MALHTDNATFMVYIATLAEPTIMLIYSSYEGQVALLINIEISTKYSNFLNVFTSNSTLEWLKYTRINDHLINLLKDKQPLYCLIYNLK